MAWHTQLPSYRCDVVHVTIGEELRAAAAAAAAAATAATAAAAVALSGSSAPRTWMQ